MPGPPRGLSFENRTLLWEINGLKEHFLRCRSHERLKLWGPPTNEHMVVEMPMSQWANESVNQWINESTIPCMNDSVSPGINEPLNQWINEQMKKSVEKWGNQRWFNEPIPKQWTKGWINGWMNRWMGELLIFVELLLHWAASWLRHLFLSYFLCEPPFIWATYALIWQLALLQLLQANSSLRAASSCNPAQVQHDGQELRFAKLIQCV